MSFQLQVVVDGQVSFLKLSQIHMVYQTQPGAMYTLVDKNGDVILDKLELRHHLDRLEVIYDQDPIAVLESFYSATNNPAMYSLDGTVGVNGSSQGQRAIISGGGKSEPGLVWSYETDALMLVEDTQDSVEDVILESTSNDEASSAPHTEEVAAVSVIEELNAKQEDQVDQFEFYEEESGNGILYTTLGTLGAVGVAALASSGGDSSSNSAPAALRITSDSSASVEENIGGGQVVYTAVANDNGSVNYSLSGIDANSFTIDGITGEVTLIENPDFETKSSYSFDVSAADVDGNVASQSVSLSIEDVQYQVSIEFDLISGTSSDDNGRIFDLDTEYTITVTTDGSSNFNTNLMWSSAENLSNDDIVILNHSNITINRGTNTEIINGTDTTQFYSWIAIGSGGGTNFETVSLYHNGAFNQGSSSVDLWNGTAASLSFQTA
ncbi:cadherin repeat domain-containing protein [Vibrio sp. WJH972]